MGQRKGIHGYVNEHTIQVLMTRRGDDQEAKAEPVGTVVLDLLHPDLSEAQRSLLVNYWGVTVDVKCPLNVEIKSPLRRAIGSTLGGMR